MRPNEAFIPQRVAIRFRHMGICGHLVSVMMIASGGRLSLHRRSLPARLCQKLYQHNRELKTLTPVLEQERRFGRLRDRTEIDDSGDWAVNAEKGSPRLGAQSESYVRHAHSPISGPLWKTVSTVLDWTEGRARMLIDLGGVYHKPEDAPGTAKPKRSVDPQHEVRLGEYLRIFPDPRRYPAYTKMDWEFAIVYEAEDVMLVNKPAGVPVHATLDNFRENMLAGLRVLRPKLEAFLPHRLDIDTSGLVIVAKNREVLRVANDIIKGPGLELQTGERSQRARRAKRKTSQRDEVRATLHRKAGGDKEAGAEREVERTKPSGYLRKRYRALVEVLPGRGPLRASTAPLIHFQKVSCRAPKMFSSDRPQGDIEESWIECRLLVLSTRDALPPLGREGLRRKERGGEDQHDCGDRKFQEVEVELLTGRTHQIRGQLAAEGCPIYGDFLYGPVALLPHERSPSLQAPYDRTPTLVAQQAGADRGDLKSSYLLGWGVEATDKGGELRRIGPDSFVASPGLALQAHHVSLELGNGVKHAFTLGRDTCWWSIADGPPR